MKTLPLIDEAGKIAVGISEQLPEPLNANEQAFFVAGFQGCVKYLSNKKMQSDATSCPLYTDYKKSCVALKERDTELKRR